MNRLIVALLLAVLSSSAMADYVWRVNGQTWGTPTPEETCAIQAPYNNTTYVSVIISPTGDGANCMGRQNGGNLYSFNQVSRYGTPPAIVCPAVGQKSGEGTETEASSLSLNLCINGCGFDGAGGMGKAGKYHIFGPFTSTGACTAGGGSPDPGDRCSYRNPASGACEAACPTGQYYGQVPTGAMACIKKDNSPPEPPKDKTCPYGYHDISTSNFPNCAPDTPNPPAGDAKCSPGTHLVGSAPGYCKANDPTPDAPTTAPPKTDTKTTGPETSTNNPDGSNTKTTTTTTTNSDGSNTTTTKTTTTKTDGTKTESTTAQTGKVPGTDKDGKSDGTDQDKSDLCKLHPELNICKNSSVSVANCQAVECNGDAIQCAVLRQEMKSYCENIKATPLSIAGDAIAAGNDPLKAGFPTPQNGLVLDIGAAGQLDTSGFLGGGSCFSDKSFSIGGRSVAVPFSKVCEYLTPLRLAVMLLALMASYRMVAGTILRDI